jgi:hypothetical protein
MEPLGRTRLALTEAEAATVSPPFTNQTIEVIAEAMVIRRS